MSKTSIWVWSGGVVVAVLVAVAIGVSCSSGEGESAGRVVLYSSVDDYVLREVIDAFEKAHGLEVLVVGDTEATKTFGLVERLLAERESPRADVWWSSEPFGTIRLAGEGIFAEYTSEVEAEFEGGWPIRDEGSEGRGGWYGFARRGRVLAYNTERVKADEAPHRLADLVEARWKGRVGMADPRFGTTRGAMAALVAKWGSEQTRQWLEAMKGNGMRLYAGNSTAVRAVAAGEIDVCLTDTDDVWAAQANGWPVSLVYESLDSDQGADFASFGALLLPNTVALVRGGPNPQGAAILIDYLLGVEVERILASSDSHNIAMRAEIAREFGKYAVEHPAELDLAEVASKMDEAMALCAEVLGHR